MTDHAPKRRGRRPLSDDDPSVTVAFRLPSKQFDGLCRAASTERVSLADLVRSVLAERLRRP